MSEPLSRREFLGGTAAAFALPYILPSGVLAAPGRPGANDRIVVANIGIGGMGSSHIRPDSAALCDVDDAHLAAGAKRVTVGTPALYKDYRRILDRKDIDAVTIGTPDHWHALMAVHACQAGKHVYSEKPTCKTIEEGRAMVNAARRYDKAVQIGAQGRSNPAARDACRFVRNGMLGKVSRVEIWHPVNFSTTDWGTPQPVPPGLDWDMWLGPARFSPYHSLKAHFNFRWFWDYGEGFIRDRGNHALSIVSWLMNNDDYKGKVVCTATGTDKTEGIFDVPATMRVEWAFQNPAWTLVWDQPGTPNPRLPGEWGATYYGDKDDLIVLGGDGGCDTEAKAKNFQTPPGGFEPYLFPVEADPTERHRQNWFDCIRTGKRPVMDVEIGYRVVTLAIVGNIAYKLGRAVTYDMAAEKFVGDDEANLMLSEPYRFPWKLS